MARYAVFLRGINVGGIKVPMKNLRECLEKLGLRNVKTYLQTGNVTFNSDKSAPKLKQKIETALTRTFSYQAYVLIYNRSQLQQIIDGYPIIGDESTHRYALLCKDPVIIKELVSQNKSLDPGVEKIAAGKLALYWQVKKGMTTDSAFGKLSAKPKYKSLTTTRNLNTLEKML